MDVRFDGWTLDRSSGELRRDGVCVRLQGRPLAVLEELLAHPGELVTREQLIARLWPRGVVDFDTALNTAVRRLRTALGDHAETPRYIQTIPRRGYRFVGRLEAPANPTPATGASPPVPARSPNRPSRQWLVAAALVLGLATLAVVTAGRKPGESVVRTVPAAPPQAAGVPIEASATERIARARFLLQRRGSGDLTRALRYFEQAVALDPRNPDAWAGLASAYWLETVEGRLPKARGLPQVRAAAERALALDPGLVEARLRLANYCWHSGDRAAGDRHLRLALDAEPANPLALSFAASIAASDGNLEEAIRLQRLSVTADPLSIPSRHNLAVLLYLAGRMSEAREALLEMREFDPGATDPAGMLSLVLVAERKFDEALALLGQEPDDTEQLQSRALANAGLGRRDDAERALRALLESSPRPDPIRVAEVYAYLGEPDLAFRWLRAAREPGARRRCATTRCWPLELAVRSPLLRSLHADPRWPEWAEAVRGDRESTNATRSNERRHTGSLPDEQSFRTDDPRRPVAAEPRRHGAAHAAASGRARRAEAVRT